MSDSEAPSSFSMPARDALEAYISEGGFVCLKQTSIYDDPSIICLELDQIDTVIGWLTALRQEVQADSE